MPFPHGYVAIDVDLVAIGGYAVKQCVCNAATAQMLMPAFQGNLGTQDSR